MKVYFQMLATIYKWQNKSQRILHFVPQMPEKNSGKREWDRQTETDRGRNRGRSKKTEKQIKYTKWGETITRCSQKSEILGSHNFNCQVDLLNRPRSSLNMLIENPYATSYFMELVLAVSITMLKIFTVQMCMTLTLTNRRRWVTDRS